MNYVINPMLFYWCNVSDTAKDFAMIAEHYAYRSMFGVLFVGAFHIGEAFNYGGSEDSDDYKIGIKFFKLAQKCICPLVILLMLSTFYPEQRNTVQNDGCKRCYIREYRPDCRNH